MRLACWMVFVLVGLSGCSSTAYLLQAATGHLSLLSKAEPVEQLLEGQTISPRLRQQLEYTQQIRNFAVDVLSLPENGSYRNYVQLNRPYVVWNVVASSPDKFELKTWCFLFSGCVSYKGFYDEAKAQSIGEQLRKEGLDVAVMGVPAYSTLGYTNDPIISTFVYYPAGELARVIFHELAHQVVYVGDDSTFNESFATAVEEIGVMAWLDTQSDKKLRVEYDRFDARRLVFRDLIAQTRKELEAIYQNAALSGTERQVLKKKSIGELLMRYKKIKQTLWQGWTGYDAYFSTDLNNAKFGVAGLYNQFVPAFKALFALCGSDFSMFYRAVDTLGHFNGAERYAVLVALTQNQKPSHNLGCSSAD